MWGKFRLSVPRKLFLTYVLLVTPNFVVFYLFRGYLLVELLSLSQTSNMWIFLGEISYTLAVMVFALLEVFLIKIINKKKLLIIYVFFSIFVNSLFFIFSKGPIVLLICALSGGAYGLGFPLIHSLIIDNTPIEERCRLLGFIVFISIIVFLVSFIVSTLFLFTLNQFFVLIIILQLSGLLSLNYMDLLNFYKPTKSHHFFETVSSKKFLLYFIPWLMFSFSNSAAILVVSATTHSEIILAFTQIVKFLTSSIFLIISGILADKYGRKLPLLIGFVMLGLTFALYPFLQNPIIYIFATMISGIAWSSILVSYLFVILGDLSPEGSRDKYYSLGVITSMFFEFFAIFIIGYYEYYIPTGIGSSILSVSLFLSVIPLLYAPETLPQEKMENRKINDYLNRVMKILESTNDD